MTQNKNPIQKKFATLAARAIFVCPISLLFAPKIAFLWQNLYYFSGKAWALKMVILHIFNWSFDDSKQKSNSKKVCNFGCQSCFCMFYFIAFCSKNSLFVPNLALIALGDSHHSQGGVWNLPHKFHLYLIFKTTKTTVGWRQHMRYHSLPPV